MKELTQQELIRVFSAYLSYDIKFKHIDHGYDFTNPKEIITEIDAISKDWISFKDGADYYFKRGHDDDFIEVKPILWDLSMLTKEIEHEGNTFVPIVEILRKTSLLDLSSCKFDVYQDEEKFTGVIYVNAEDEKGRIIDSMYYDNNLFWHANNGGGYSPTNPQSEPQEMLLSFHLNVFNLDESQFINKANLKN